MKLTFLGTRGNIEAPTQCHRMHNLMKVSYYETEVVIDCGEDWLGEVDDRDRRHPSEPAEGDERTLGAKIRDLAEERGIHQVEIAHDGMEIVLR